MQSVQIEGVPVGASKQQGPPRNDFFQPSERTQQLVGYGILEYQSRASNSNKGAVKDIYRELVGEFFQSRQDTGAPRTVQEALDLWCEISQYIWGQAKFRYKPTTQLFEGLLSGRLDCDTSAMLAAEIFRQAGVQARLVVVSGHAILGLKIGGKELYLETNYFLKKGEIRGYEGKAYYLSRQDVLKKYGSIIEEVDFRQGFYGKWQRAQLYRGLAALENGNFDQAIKDLTSLQKLFREHTFVQCKIGEAYLAKNDSKNALKFLNKAVLADGTNALAYAALAEVHLRLGNYHEAEDNAEKAIEHSSKKAFRGATKYDRNAPPSKIASGEFSSPADLIRARALLVRGQVRFKNGSYLSALQDFERAERLLSKLDYPKAAEEARRMIEEIHNRS